MPLVPIVIRSDTAVSTAGPSVLVLDFTSRRPQGEFIRPCPMRVDQDLKSDPLISTRSKGAGLKCIVILMIFRQNGCGISE